jgi:hypothetical protein
MVVIGSLSIKIGCTYANYTQGLSMATKGLTGQRIGRLIVQERSENDGQNRAQWLCLCDCGNAKVVKSASLVRLETRSCGCLGRETRKVNGDLVGQRRDHAFSRRRMPSLRRTWEAMLARCTDPTNKGFANYGGRGITVCKEWLESFAQFAIDVGRRTEGCSLERKDNDGNYCKDNCTWATRTEQANNRRTNRRITVDGVTQTVAQWARQLGISCHVIHTRIYKGMDEIEAVRKSM